MKKNFITLLTAIILPTLTQAAQPNLTTPDRHISWPAHSNNYYLALKHNGGLFRTNGKEYALTNEQVDILLNMLGNTHTSNKLRNKNILSTATAFALKNDSNA